MLMLPIFQQKTNRWCAIVYVESKDNNTYERQQQQQQNNNNQRKWKTWTPINKTDVNK